MKDRKLKEEFIQQVEENQGIVFKVSKMYCYNEIDREDLFQDILLQLWKSFPNFKGNSKFSTWMYRVALNTAITRFRKEKKQDNEVPVSEFKMDIPEGESYTEKEERANILHRGIGKLNKVEKAIIILYMDDYPYDEIAEISGLTVNNVGVKIVRIKKKLQNILNGLGYGS